MNGGKLIPYKPSVAQLSNSIPQWAGRVSKVEENLQNGEKSFKELMSMHAKIRNQDDQCREKVDRLMSTLLDIKLEMGHMKQSADKTVSDTLTVSQLVHGVKRMYDSCKFTTEKSGYNTNNTSSGSDSLSLVSIPSKFSLLLLEHLEEYSNEICERMECLKRSTDALERPVDTQMDPALLQRILEGLEKRLSQCHEREVNIFRAASTLKRALARRGYADRDLFASLPTI